jgi:hypothetical protein
MFSRTVGEKPLGIKNYGSIGHLPNSRMGSGDHSIEKGQADIATKKLTKNKRGLSREIIVQEKLDGSNVGIARVDGRIFPLTRSGYVADTSPYEQHHAFHRWVLQQPERWDFIKEGERLVGEWLMQAHSTRYELKHEPFVAFDLMIGDKRLPYDEFIERVSVANLITPHLIHRGEAISEESVMTKLGKYGFHGATDEVEGAVWRIELLEPKGRRVEYLTKFVRPEKIDGIYLKDKEGNNLQPIYNWKPL